VVSTAGKGEFFWLNFLGFSLNEFSPKQSEPFEDVTTYRGDIIVGLKFIPSDSSSSHSHGLSLRKFSMKSNSSSSSANNGSTTTPTHTPTLRHTKGQLHILVKEAKHLSPVKASGLCDAFCKRWVC
jgi:synaptotagmin-like protein